MHKRITFRMAVTVLACLATFDMAAAYYSPNQGRWIKRDPIGEEGGLNQHAFVANRPTNAVDPDGQLIIGLTGYGVFGGSGQSEINRIGKAIAEEINVQLEYLRLVAEHRGVRLSVGRETLVRLDGTNGQDIGRIAKEAKAFRKRLYGDAGSRKCYIEGFVLFGYSDGATSIYEFFQRGLAAESLKANDVTARISYVGFIDMVHKSFPFNKLDPRAGQELRKDKGTDFENRRLSMRDAGIPYFGDVFYQNSDSANINHWKGYTHIDFDGRYRSIPISPSSHLEIIGDSTMQRDLIESAVETYHMHILLQWQELEREGHL